MINGNRTKSNRGRSPRDFYKTPKDLAEAAIDRIQYDEEIAYYMPVNYILDAGCGDGVWAKECIRLVYPSGDENCYPFIEAIDLEPCIKERPDLVDKVITGDFLEYNPKYHFDLVCGNPPYSLAEEFIRHSFELLSYTGYIYFLLRLSFLEGIARGRGLFKEFPIKRVYVCSRRPSFFSTDEKKHTTDTLAYAMFLWQKGYNGKTELDYLDWEYKK
jgi:hypothetical protein